MHFVEYIRDIKEYTTRWPYKEEIGSSKVVYWRNAIYVNAQSKYLYGKVINKLVRLADNVFFNPYMERVRKRLRNASAK